MSDCKYNLLRPIVDQFRRGCERALFRKAKTNVGVLMPIVNCQICGSSWEGTAGTPVPYLLKEIERLKKELDMSLVDRAFIKRENRELLDQNKRQVAQNGDLRQDVQPIRQSKLFPYKCPVCMGNGCGCRACGGTGVLWHE